MGHTNSTTYYSLPQFLTTDKPAWLTDINGAMSAIDTGLNTAQSDATTAGNNATQALSDASAAASAASAADAKGAGALASIEATFDATTVYAVGAKVIYNSLLYRCTVAVTTPGPWTGSANWERITVDSIIPSTAGDIPLGTDFTDPTSTASAINALGTAFAGYVLKVYTGTMPNSQTNDIITVDTGVDKGLLLGCIVHRNGDDRYDNIPTGITGSLAHMDILSYDDGTLKLRAYIDTAAGVTLFGSASFTAICAVKYS